MPWSLQVTYGHPFVLKRRSKVLKSRKLKPHMIYGYSSTFLHHNFYMITMSTENLSHLGTERISHRIFTFWLQITRLLLIWQCFN